MATKLDKKDIKGIVINGTEYVTKDQVCALTGYSRQGLDRKLKAVGMTWIVTKSRRALVRLSDVNEAISDGRLVKYM